MIFKVEFDYVPSVTTAALGAWSIKITNKLGLDIIRYLQAANPVDTTFSRGRWIYIPVTVPFGTGKVTNDAYYILYLNAGTSKQAAAGWIEAGLQAAVRFLR